MSEVWRNAGPMDVPRDVPRWKRKKNKYKEEIVKNVWKYSGVAQEFSKSPPKGYD